MIRCPRCLIENSDIDIFCKNCGAILFPLEKSFKEIRKICIMFGDIVNFTSSAEKMDAEIITNVLGVVFDEADKIIKNHKGFINRLIGDEYMAIFGYPEHNDDSVKSALESALQINDFLKEKDFSKISGGIVSKIVLRTGIADGNVSIGVDRDVYDTLIVIGDTVFKASQIEKLVEPGMIGVDQDTSTRMKEFVFSKAEAREDIKFNYLKRKKHA